MRSTEKPRNFIRSLRLCVAYIQAPEILRHSRVAEPDNGSRIEQKKMVSEKLVLPKTCRRS